MLSPAEVDLLKAANQRWGRELRSASAALVDQRLARQISREEYVASRQRAKEDAEEHRRRAALLANKIGNLF